LGLKLSKSLRPVVPVALFSALGFLAMGYHPGAEDDGVYLAAVKSNLDPALYPHDAQFFRLQLQATLFDKWMSTAIRMTHIPVAWAELLGQCLSIVLIMAGTWCVARLLFKEATAVWGAMAMVSAMFTLPVAGTALYVVDNNLHPRNLATGLILLSAACILDKTPRRGLWAVPLLLCAIVLHPIMGALGISFCCFLAIAQTEFFAALIRRVREPIAVETLAGATPLGWILQPPSVTWREALNTRTYYFVYRWQWYEWLGVFGPMVIFGAILRWARKRGEMTLMYLCAALLGYAVFQQIVAMIMLTPASFIRLTPFQPMRYLHLVYLFLALIAGGLIGQHLLKNKAWRWAMLLIASFGGMFYAQRALYADTVHLEMPGARPSNAWLEAFKWIRENTPKDAYFAMDPRYMAAPGEDYHSFRALAERSQLADEVKDAAVVTQVPELGPAWHDQQQAVVGWASFKAEDFARLKARTGVDWVLVKYPQPNGLDCQWHNAVVAVCRIR
jgi:hypothetical protein